MSTSKILMLIGGFLFFTIGSFVYFIATWDRDLEEPVSSIPFALTTGDVV